VNNKVGDGLGLLIGSSGDAGITTVQRAMVTPVKKASQKCCCGFAI